MGIGIDYGRGVTNIDNATGIRYGVIATRSVDPDKLWNHVTDIYPDPACPTCGTTLVKNPLPETERAGEYFCETCQAHLEADACADDFAEPLGWTYTDDDYQLEDCLDSDLVVLKSPFYTFAQFCSPCVPGAGNLDTPMAEGVKTYCLGPEWFEADVPPYPVYAVATGERIV